MACVSIELALRTQHVDYIEYLAERDDTNFSRAFGALLEAKIQPSPDKRSKPPRKIRKRMMFIAYHLELLDQLSEKLGLSRSDTARRIIDEALAKDPTI